MLRFWGEMVREGVFIKLKLIEMLVVRKNDLVKIWKVRCSGLCS